MLKRTMAILLLCAVCVCLCGCAPKIVGTWAQGDGESVTTLAFAEDGTGTVQTAEGDIHNFTYAVEEQTVSITMEGQGAVTVPYTFAIEEHKLTLTDKDGNVIVLVET